jgi:hypothetical protein
MGSMDRRSPFEYSAEVNQAAGMVSVQANCHVDEALNLMAERAFIAHVPLDQIAAAVHDHSVRFGPDPTWAGNEKPQPRLERRARLRRACECRARWRRVRCKAERRRKATRASRQSQLKKR